MKFKEAIAKALEIVQESEVLEAYVTREGEPDNAFFRVAKKGGFSVEDIDTSHIAIDLNDWKVLYLTNLIKEVG